MKILLLEDDDATKAHLERVLSAAGHVVDVCSTGQDAIFLGSTGDHAVLILDRMVPGLDGLGALKALRAMGVRSPALFLTAMNGVEDRVEGLEAGADDYLVKPFAFSELSARINALGRRTHARIEARRLSVGDIVLDLDSRTVERGGKRVALQPREFSLLAELMRNPRRVVTRTMLLERVWDFDFDPKTNIVDTHMSRLRSKLNAGFEEDAIETVRGSGYMMRAG